MDNKLNGFGEITGVIQKTQGNQKYLFGTIRSDKVKNVTFVPVIEASRRTCLNENTIDGYQRPGSLSRMRTFARFLKDYPNSVVPPVLLSGRENWQFEPSDQGQDSGRLIIQGEAAIVDGQHRLGGFVDLYESEGEVRDVSFILLPDLTLEQEKNEFLVVNNSQKGVPKSLTAYLENTPEAQVAWGLNTVPDSLFKDRIARTGMKRNHLFTLASTAKQVKNLFSLGDVQDLDIDEKIEFMSRFWTIIADQLDEEWSDIEKLDDPETRGRSDFEHKLLELTGLIAWSLTGAHIFLRSYSDGASMNWENVRRLVASASNVDWSKGGHFANQTGVVGGNNMSNEMIRLLPPENNIDDSEDEGIK